MSVVVEPAKVDITRTQTVQKLCCCQDDLGRHRNNIPIYEC